MKQNKIRAKAAVIIIGFFMFMIMQAHSLHVDAGFQIPLNFGMNFAGEAGIWPGFIFGGGATAGFGFLENAFMPGSRFGIGAFGVFTAGTYWLPSDKFAQGSFITSLDFRYGLNLMYYFQKGWFAGAGVTMAYVLGGEYGTPSYKTNFSAEMTGHDIYVSLVGGYELEIVRDRIYLPVEGKISYALTVPNALVFEAGLSLSLVYRLTISPAEPPKAIDPRPVEEKTNAVKTLKKFSQAEIQKKNVSEIVMLAKEALTQNEREYAKVLLKEGLVKEPDNAELIQLFTEVMR